jgi:hypothetical protein
VLVAGRDLRTAERVGEEWRVTIDFETSLMFSDVEFRFFLAEPVRCDVAETVMLARRTGHA